MKNKLFILFLLLPNLCFGAISANTSWELRSTATANNVNGGGFVAGASGVDYSQQDTAHLTITDLASDASGKVSSALTPFDTNDIGNILHITAAGTGFTIGWYEVIDVSGGVLAELDRSPGASKTGGTAYLGGAMSLNSTLESEFFNSVVAGNTIWVKYGTYNYGETTFSASNGTADAPIKLLGYNTTRGDKPTGISRPTLAQGVYRLFCGQYWEVGNFITTGTSATIFLNGYYGKAYNLKVLNTSSTAGRAAFQANAQYGRAYNIEAISLWGNAYVDGYECSLLYSYLHDSVNLVSVTADGSTLIGNIFESPQTAAISSDRVFTLLNNTFFGASNKTGIGLSLTGTAQKPLILNNIFSGFTTAISHATAGQTGTLEDYNDFYNNTADYTSGGVATALNTNDQTLDPGFINEGQVTGTTGKFAATGDKLIDTSKNFTALGVVAGQDFVYIKSGTGLSNVGIYAIDSISTTTNPNDTLGVTIPDSPGTNTTADKVYQITTGHNFAIGTNLKALGFPGAFPGGLTTGYTDIGAVQREEAGGGSCNDVFGAIM